MYWDHMNGWGWTMMILWSMIWIGFLGVVGYAVINWARGGSHTPDRGASADKTARELLDERLARGEIDTDEYQRRRAALEDHQSAGAAR
jgi:putative membrane protein